MEQRFVTVVLLALCTCGQLLRSALGAARTHKVAHTPDAAELEYIHTRVSNQGDWDVDFNSTDTSTPPVWLLEYVAFHRRAKGKPGAQYLVSTCNRLARCGGLGDRIRGIIQALLLARMHHRVLLVSWEDPGPLETFLNPADLDWTIQPELFTDLNTSKLFFGNQNSVPNNLLDFKPPPGAQAVRAWWICTTLFDGRHLLSDMPPFARVSPTSHLIMKALFKPSPELERRTNAVLAEMFPGAPLDRPYVAVHLRMAHMDGEPGLENRFGETPQMHALIAAWECAQRMTRALHFEEQLKRYHKQAQSSSVPTHTQQHHHDMQHQQHPHGNRIVLLTDHFELRRSVSHGLLGGVVGPTGEAHHIGDAKNRTNDAHFGTFVDLLLMARARCLVWADSGFPKTAIMWAWHECSRELPLCIEESFNTTELAGAWSRRRTRVELRLHRRRMTSAVPHADPSRADL